MLCDNAPCEITGQSRILLGIAPLPDGGVIVLWVETRPNENGNRLGPTNHILFAQRFSGDLSPIGERVVIETQQYGDDRLSDIAADERGNFVIVWYDFGYEDRFGNGELWPTKSYLYAQRFDAVGERRGHAVLVHQGVRVEYKPKVVMDSAGGMLITFRYGAYMGARYDSEGNRTGPEFQVNLGSMSPSGGPCLADQDDRGKMVFLYPQMWIGEGEPYAPAEYLTNIFLRIVEPQAPVFIRGDVNGDGKVSILDAIVILRYLFSRGALDLLDAADANDDETLKLSDAIYLLGFLFAGNPPALPHPWPHYGFDPTQ